MGDDRPSWDDYFMSIAEVVASRSTCLRTRVGAVLVQDKRLLTTGYNGAPTGFGHCPDVGCLREQMAIPSGERQELCRGLHAEQNALVQAALHGVSVRDSILYCTLEPCITCAKMLINAGVRLVIYRDEYPDRLARAFFEEGGVKIRQWTPER